MSTRLLLDFVKKVPDSAIILKNIELLDDTSYASLIFDKRDLRKAIDTVEREIRKAKKSGHKRGKERASRLTQVHGILLQRSFGLIECGPKGKAK